ncbi:hypothetical protein B0H13DRAFT_2236318 [Mycena leptocephala]|nr:hypothetical protein B0H13DRAFT_2236318 [Mycena leptocephala]
MPASPWTPTVAITIRALEVYRVAHLRCPRLGIQAFVRALCDIHGVVLRQWLGAQFSVAFDVYLAIRAVVDNTARRQLRRAGDYYLACEEVDRWSKDGVDELMKGEEEHGCSKRWQNMKEDITSHRLLPCLCRHGFVLIVVDMVKSGELSKYGLSIVNHLLNVLGEIALGYDIGCKFGKLVKAHPTLKDIACEKDFRALIGAFHGHGHNRLCGLDNLMIYVKGVGLEALETCESFFSKSNALASTTHYASRFHRQQAITTYLKHADQFDTYQGLTLGLCNKYRRALEIKATHTSLHDAMRELSVHSRDEFEAWRAKEKAHLRTLSKELPEETLEMEYYQKLVNLQDAEYVPPFFMPSCSPLMRRCRERVATIVGVEPLFVPVQNAAGYGEAVKATQRLETQWRHALELQAKALFAVQDLEVRLAVAERWAPGDGKWEEVAAMVTRSDDLQGLIIARMFELAKCNMSGTGYKLRKHIAKALQARSKAVKNAIERYNEQAAAMDPLKPMVDWDEVVEYAFIADFDLLREGREDIRGELWAQPAGRRAMDQHFKLLRANEEIVRLNLEICRLVTYMVDEEAFLSREEERLRAVGMEGLAVQVGLLCMERGWFTDLHMSRLVKLSKVPGFTGSILPGVSVCHERHTPVARPDDVEMHVASPLPPSEEDGVAPPDDDDEEVESDDDDGVLTDTFLNILRISRDGDREVGDT